MKRGITRICAAEHWTPWELRQHSETTPSSSPLGPKNSLSFLLFTHHYALLKAALAFPIRSLLHALSTAVLISGAGLAMPAHLARYGLAAADQGAHHWPEMDISR